MAKQIVTWCDPCQAEDVEAQAVSYSFTIDGKERSLDLCQAHWDQLVKPLQALLLDYGTNANGRRYAPRKAASGTEKASPTQGTLNASEEATGPSTEATAAAGFPCIICGAVLHIDTTYRRHMRDQHGISPAVVAGSSCPVCGQEGLGKMGVHVKSAHPETGASNGPQALAWAMQQGDPHGVAARQLAAARKAMKASAQKG